MARDLEQQRSIPLTPEDIDAVNAILAQGVPLEVVDAYRLWLSGLPSDRQQNLSFRTILGGSLTVSNLQHALEANTPAGRIAARQVLEHALQEILPSQRAQLASSPTRLALLVTQGLIFDKITRPMGRSKIPA